MGVQTPESSRDTLRCAQGVGVQASPEEAARAACAEVRAAELGRVHLAFVAISAHHAEDAARIAAIVRQELTPDHLLGSTTDCVIVGVRELEHTPAVGVLALRLPGVDIRPFGAGSFLSKTNEPTMVDECRTLIGASPVLRCSIVIVDPASVPILSLLPALNAARETGRDGRPAGVVVGGLAWTGDKNARNSLLLDDRVRHDGLVGVSLSGRLRVDAVVSQGCRGFGPPMVVTRARANVIQELGGRPALDAVRDVLDTLNERDRELVRTGLFVGCVVNEYKDRFGRGDYLIRNVAGVNPQSSSLMLHGLVRVGQTVQLHLRDAETAHEDLQMLLNAQQLHGPPAGVLLATCTGRGRRLFPTPDHDALSIQRAFAEPPSGEEAAKGGVPIDPSRRPIPLVGFSAAGEIGPVGPDCHLHGHTACALMFRAWPGIAPHDDPPRDRPDAPGRSA